VLLKREWGGGPGAPSFRRGEQEGLMFKREGLTKVSKQARNSRAQMTLGL
jgi:hypothetical protein